MAQHELNGRQIKNIVKVATSLASEKGEDLVYEHLIYTLRTMMELRSPKVLEPTTTYLGVVKARFLDTLHYFKSSWSGAIVI